MASEQFASPLNSDALLTAVEIGTIAEVQVVWAGMLWIRDCLSMEDALKFATKSHLVSADQGAFVALHLHTPWTVEIQTDSVQLRELGFRFGGLFGGKLHSMKPA